MYYLWLIWEFAVFLRGKSWKFQAPAVTHVSTLPIARPLKPIRPSPGTVLWSKLYSRKIFLDHRPVIMFNPTGNCHPSLNVLRLLLLKSSFKCLWGCLFLLSFKLLTVSNFLFAFPLIESLVAIMREYLFFLTRAPWTMILTKKTLNKHTSIQWVIQLTCREREGTHQLSNISPTVCCVRPQKT